MTVEIRNPYSIRLGVVGAGTMGSGIALTALRTGMLVTLYDVSEEMLSNARGYIEEHLARKKQSNLLRNLQTTQELQDMHGAGVVIEAVPENLDLKKEIFSQLDEICPPPAVLATNTSTLAVTAIAAAASHPERVAGMHFFNPAPVLPLVEVIQAAHTNPATLRTLVQLAELLGKQPVVAQDTPGFIVNRVARPFYGEALRLLGEGAAGHEEIDHLVSQGGGFPMGPFELMDLIGIDINLAAMQSMYEQTSGEPRYRPHQIQFRMVHQQALGRKSGRGFYDYTSGSKPQKPEPPRMKANAGQVLLSTGSWSPGLRELLEKSGYTPNGAAGGPIEPLAGIVVAGKHEDLKPLVVQMDRDLPPGRPLFCQCADVTLTEVATWIRHAERLVGFDGLFFANGPAATLVASPTLQAAARGAASDFIRGLGREAVWVADLPGLVLPRIVSMLANEAAFAAAEGVAEPDTIDQAMRLGTGYPLGPLAWAKKLGYQRVLAVLDHLFDEYHETRYRASPLLRRWERLERIGGL